METRRWRATVDICHATAITHPLPRKPLIGTEDTMVERTARLSISLAGHVFAVACGMNEAGDLARVTIDMRCESNRDCPAGFACNAEAEHGPPTTTCDSGDPAVTCPPGYA